MRLREGRNLIHLDLNQSEMPRVINRFWPKFVDGSTSFKFLKLGHGEEEEITKMVLNLLAQDIASY